MWWPGDRGQKDREWEPFSFNKKQTFLYSSAHYFFFKNGIDTHTCTPIPRDTYVLQYTAIRFPVMFLMAILLKKVCSVPKTCYKGCVCLCVSASAKKNQTILSCSHYANEHLRFWDLKTVAKFSQADNTITPQHLHLSGAWNTTAKTDGACRLAGMYVH